MRGRIALSALTLCACGNKPEAPEPTYLSPDGDQAFEALQAKLTAQLLDPRAQGPGHEPYQYYSAPGGRTSYLITVSGAPAHPAIMMQLAKSGEVTTTGCPYGDPEAYDQLHVYLDSLKSWRRD